MESLDGYSDAGPGQKPGDASFYAMHMDVDAVIIDYYHSGEEGAGHSPHSA